MDTIERQPSLGRRRRRLQSDEFKADAVSAELLWDGESTGELVVQGHWIVERHFGAEGSALVDGWLPTGDVATIDPDGYMRITDRAKDVVKSGGEWISSIKLENVAMAHPAVSMAVCIAKPHPKWDERPLLVVVLIDGQVVTAVDLLKFLDGKVAK